MPGNPKVGRTRLVPSVCCPLCTARPAHRTHPTIAPCPTSRLDPTRTRCQVWFRIGQAHASRGPPGMADALEAFTRAGGLAPQDTGG
jgi:hypothetical protein